MAKSYDALLRLLLVGDTGVGKTCLICQYACHEFHENHITTIGVDFKMKTVEVDGRFIKMQIWDTAGQERFEAITKQFFTRAQGCMLVYDICSRSSFEALAKWLLYVKQYTKDKTSIVMVGNKCDLEHKRQVQKITAQQFARENGLTLYEASAKKFLNLNEPFQDLCRQILRQEEDIKSSQSSPKKEVTVDLTEDRNQSASLKPNNSTGTRNGEEKSKKNWNCC